MNSRAKYLLKNTGIFAIGALGTRVISFFLVPFYTYILSTEEYGTVDLIFTLCTLVVPVITFNIGEAVMRYGLDEGADYRKISGIIFGTTVFSCLAAALVLVACGMNPVTSPYSVNIYLLVVSQGFYTNYTCYLRGTERLTGYTLCNFVNVCLIAVLNILFLKYLNLKIDGYLLAYTLAYFAAGGMAFVMGRQPSLFFHYKFDKALFKEMAAFSLLVIPNSMMWWVITSSDRLMVAGMKGLADNGILAVAYKIPSLLSVLSTVLMQAWKYSAIKEEKSEDIEAYSNQVLKEMISIMVLISGTILLVIKPAAGILFEESYFESWRASSFLIIGFVFMSVSTFAGTMYYVKKDMVGNLRSALIGALVNLILNLFLIHTLGAVGAAIASCCSYMVILLYRVRDTEKYLKLDLKRPCYGIFLFLLLGEILGLYLGSVAGCCILAAAYLGIVVMNLKSIRGYIIKAKNILKV